MTEKPTGQDEAISGVAGESQDQPKVASAADMQAFLGRQLRAVFDDVAKQPVPDRFIELMRQLENKERQG